MTCGKFRNIIATENSEKFLIDKLMKKSQKNKIKFAIKIAIRALTPFVCLLVMSAEMFDYSAIFDYLDKVYSRDVE